MRETTLSLPELSLVAGTRLMLGAGRLLLAAGWTLFLAGALTTIPLALLVLGKSRKVQNSSLPDGIPPDG